MKSGWILWVLCALAGASPAQGQTIFSPQTGNQGVSGVAGIALSPGAPWSLPAGPQLLLSFTAPTSLPPVIIPKISPIAGVEAAALAQGPGPARSPHTKVGAELASFRKIAEESRRDERGANVEKGLQEAFDGKALGALAPAPAVDFQAEPDWSRASLSRPQASLRDPAQVPGPARLLKASGRVLSAGIGLYGGWKIGDAAYSLFLHRLPLLGGALAVVLLPLAAYWARRSKAAGRPQRPVIPFLIGSFAANALGNLLWTVTGSAAAGLGLGLALGLALGLYASGAAKASGR
jgi:hypothetical protein